MPAPVGTHLVTQRFGNEQARTLAGYEATGGYSALRKALSMRPEDIQNEVKASNLRGRGGAGFATGVKWGFVPKDAKEVHLVCNCDESEPGTCKDRLLVWWDPHLLIEGMIIAAHALKAKHNYIYIRGEMMREYVVLDNAVKEAYARGYLGDNVLGTGIAVHLTVHRGAGAYICGEETALLNSLEGQRGQPRLKPPFPAVEGLYASPTVVNNVETLMNVPHILKNGAQWYRQWGTEKSAGTKIMSLSGPVKRPGNYEIPLGLPLRTLIESPEYGGGMRDGMKVKAIIPGGSSVPMMPASQIDTHLDYESLNAVGTFLGSGGVIVIDDQTCIVDALWNISRFYRHESCGKCTPCREGTYWMVEILERIEKGGGRETDIDVLLDVAGNVFGKSFCALGDAAAMPVQGAIKHFRAEFEHHVRNKSCLVNRRRHSVSEVTA